MSAPSPGPVAAPTQLQRLAARQPADSAVAMTQDWNNLLFLHWEVAPEIVQATLPRGLHVDTFDGKTYLGVVPFFMACVRPAYCPAVPGLSWFQELNLRTYVHDGQGNPGVWFYSLDCNQWLAVKLARRFFHLPYRHAVMTDSRDGDDLVFRSQQESDSVQQVFRYPAKIAGTALADPESLEFFLLERYRLYSADKQGRLYSGRVHHSPYRFETVDIESYSSRPLTLAGFDEPEGPPVSSLASKDVSVKIYPLRRHPVAVV